MRVYLDNCCYNRPFDVQGQLRVRLETEAKPLDYTQWQQDLFPGMSIDEIGAESRKVGALVAPLIHGREI